MNDFKLSPDDPKLTAYALGELESDARAAIEAALQHDPEARAVVEDIRAAAAQIETALAQESSEMEPEVRRDFRPPRKSMKLLRFPQIYYLIGGLAAACFAVVVALHETSPRLEKHYVELALPAAAPSPTADSAANSVAKASAVSASSAASFPQSKVEVPEFDAKISGLLAQSKKPAELSLQLGSPETAGSLRPLPPRLAEQTASLDAHAIAGDAVRRKQSLDVQMANKPVAIDSAADKTISGAAGAQPQSQTNAQESPAPVNAREATTPVAENDAVIKLSPFEVTASPNSRYAAASTLAGTRLQSNLKNIGSAIHVTTSEFLNEIPAGRESALRYSSPKIGGGKRSAQNTEAYAYRAENDFLTAAENPLSTFSADVDTASYSNVRRMIEDGQRPPIDAVRIEELVNYFPYHYPPPNIPTERREEVALTMQKAATQAPDAQTAPFAVSMEVADAPWAPTHRLVRIGLKGREVGAGDRGAANLVFLLDVSGSMDEPNKLPLVKESMRLLLSRLRADDRVAIVTYAGASGLALPSTPVAKASEIVAALEELRPEGSTNGAMGIQLAYDVAKANFVNGGINRVILCTDGDFNVGVTSEGELTRLIAEKAKSGVFLTVLGFGMGNIKDSILEQLADRGNGNYGYIDARREAEKLLVEQVNGTLVPIAKDVKLQVEFNPARVARYRLIGYEKRLLHPEDFNNDKVDAGEIGAGHTVTALYEIVPVGADDAKPDPEHSVDERGYAVFSGASPTAGSKAKGNADELLSLKLRYKDPAADVSRKLVFPLKDSGGHFAAASGDFKFAAAVAAFGMVLRDSPHKRATTLADVVAWAEQGARTDPGGYRAEFIGMVKRAQTFMR